MDEALELADWRRRVAELYLAEPREGREGVEAENRLEEPVRAGERL